MRRMIDMSEAYICDVTGETKTGSGAKQFDVEVTDKLVLKVIVFLKEDPKSKRLSEGHASPEGIAAITAALKQMKLK